MRLFSLLAVLALVAAVSACSKKPIRESGRVNGAYAGCATVGLLSSFVSAASRDDLDKIRDLLLAGCMNLDGKDFVLVEKKVRNSRIKVSGRELDTRKNPGLLSGFMIHFG